MKKLTPLSKARILVRYERLREAFGRKIRQYETGSMHFWELVEHVAIGVFTVDLEGRIQFFNKEAERISGYQRDEIRSSHFRSLLSLDDISEGFKIFYQAARGAYPKSLLFRVRKKIGATIITELEVAPFYQGGKLEGVIAFMKDRTERKKLEESNRKRVEAFIEFSHQLDQWHVEVLSLKREVNDLLVALGRKEKYSLPS